MSSEKLQNISFSVVEFSGLGMQFTEITQVLWQGQMVKRPGNTLVFNDVILQLLMDEDYTSLQEIYDVMAVTQNNFAANTSHWNSDFTGVLYTSTNRNNLKKKIEFSHCWFKDITDVVFAANLNEDTPVNINVTLAFDSYTISDVT
jgi:hypothetical protein